MLVLSMLLEMFVVSNAINPNQMNIYNDIRKAKENHVNSSLKRLTKHVFCPKCNIQVRAANLEKHLAKHEVNPLMIPKIPHPPQPVRSPRKMKPPVIEIKKNAVKSSAVLRDNAEKSVSGWADKINRTGAELRALYEGKQLPKHKAEIRKAKFKATQDISCLICKTPLKSSNLNKHYKKVHGIDIQIQELEISGVGELNQDTIMITGRGQNPQEGMAVVDWLRLAAPHARRIVSICGGAMLLAQTGLLDGRRATTHWKLLETMQAEFPQIRVEGGPLYIQDEHIWTSGGVSSGFDLTLALVEEDYGFSLARDIAQDFVMYLRRPGGQLQFSRYNLQQTATQGPINDLLAWLLENLTADLSVDKLAEKVAMSPRNFTRVFTRETGASPARYVAEARLAAARQRLEQTHETLDRIAEQTGFGSSINLRRLFEKQLNLTPGEYRQRFHCRKMA